MPRRHYLVTYDISDDKRRDQVFKSCVGVGDHVQYSVFLCDLNDRELAELRAKLRRTIHQKEDQILIVDLGTASSPLLDSIEAIGQSYNPSTRIQVI